MVLVLCLPLAAPAGALAQGDPFGPIPQSPQPTPTVAPAPADPTDDGLSDTQQLLIALAGFVLLLGIAWAIVRDARQSAPVSGAADPLEAGERTKGSRTPPKRRVKQGRQRAKAARQARKRNR